MTDLLFWPDLDVGAAPLHSVASRRLNRLRVLEAVRRMGPLSRADLTRRMGLSAPTVSALVADLMEREGLLRYVGIGKSSGGRRPALLEFNGDYGYVAGLDIGSRTLRIALADLQGRVVARHQEPTCREGGAPLIAQLSDGLERVLAGAAIDRGRLLAIAAGAPGMTDVAAGRVINAVNLPGWVDVPLRDLLEARFDAPAVVDNDANMAAVGERWRGAARGVDDFVFMALGAGIGAGVIVGGRLQRGSRWSAGEISHMHLDWRGWNTSYGDQGFLESRIGALAPAGPGDARPGAFRRIFSAAARGDAVARAAVEQLAAYLGTAVANIVAVLDPALIVFGGGLSLAGDQLLEPIRQVVGRVLPSAPRMEVTALGDEAQLYGSLHSALQLADRRLHELVLGRAVQCSGSGASRARRVPA